MVSREGKLVWSNCWYSLVFYVDYVIVFSLLNTKLFYVNDVEFILSKKETYSRKSEEKKFITQFTFF